jgi:hypothetical protein
MDPRFHRALRHPQNGRDLRVRKSLDIVQDQWRPERFTELQDLPLELGAELAVEDGVLGAPRPVGEIVTGRVPMEQALETRPTAPETASAVQCSIHCDAVDEGGEARLLAEAMTAAVEVQEDLLGDILGLFAAAQHTQRQPEDPPLVATNQGLEGDLVTSAPALDQLAIGIVCADGGLASTPQDGTSLQDLLSYQRHVGV